jgi:Flp pilus assembly protein CpaB
MKGIIRKALCIVLGIGVLCFAGLKAAELYLEQKLDLVEVPGAAHDIRPRTEITEEDIMMIQVPGAYILPGTCTTKNEVLGLYTDMQGMIPAGSPFYADMLKEKKDLPDRASLQLKEGQAVYTMTPSSSDLTVLTAGMRVDLYASLKKEDGTPLTGCLLAHVRIISLQDHQGREVGEPDSGTPYLICFAVNQEDIDLLTLAEEAGEVRLFSTSESHDDREAVRCADSPLLQYLEEMKKGSEVITLND